MFAVQPHLNATERSIGFSPQDPPDLGQLVEQITIHHGHCVSEREATGIPSTSGSRATTKSLTHLHP
jgi:hypothetical protein